jgi:hypothetical protein
VTREKFADFGDMKNWVKENPLTSAAIGGGIAAAGVVGKHLTAKAAPIASRSGKRMQDLASKEGIGFGFATQAKKSTDAPTFKERVRSRLFAGGAEPVYTTPEGYVLKNHGRSPKKGVVTGLDADVGAQADVNVGGLSPSGSKAKKTLANLEKLEVAGKPGETTRSVGLSKHFAQSGRVSNTAKKLGLRTPGPKASQAEQGRYLNALQKGLIKEHGESGFLMKPSDLVASSGAFPSNKGNWGASWKDYTTRLKPEMDAMRADIAANPANYPPGKSASNLVAEKFRKDPAYIGTGLEAALKDPRRTLGQSKLDIIPGARGKPAEYRVHMIGGEVPEQLSYERYDLPRQIMGRVPGLKHLRSNKRGTPEEAAQWVRDNISPNINKKLKDGTFGLDVVRVRNPDGSLGYKMIELNPSTQAGRSGFLAAEDNPLLAGDMSRWLTGKATPLGAATKTLAAAGAGGGAVYTGARNLPTERLPVRASSSSEETA